MGSSFRRSEPQQFKAIIVLRHDVLLGPKPKENGVLGLWRIPRPAYKPPVFAWLLAWADLLGEHNGSSSGPWCAQAARRGSTHQRPPVLRELHRCARKSQGGNVVEPQRASTLRRGTCGRSW